MRTPLSNKVIQRMMEGKGRVSEDGDEECVSVVGMCFLYDEIRSFVWTKLENQMGRTTELRMSTNIKQRWNRFGLPDLSVEPGKSGAGNLAW